MLVSGQNFCRFLPKNKQVKFQTVVQMEKRDKTLEEQNIETIEFNLQERIKELNCLHQLLGAMNDQSLSSDDFLERITQIIPPAWQFPEQTGVCLEIEGMIFKTPQYRSDSPKLSEKIMIGDRTTGTIEVCLTGKPPVPGALTFLPEESQLLKIYCPLSCRVY